MRINRSIAVFFLACSCLCGLISYEKWRSAVVTGEALAEKFNAAIEGPEFKFESVGIPVETIVAGFLSVVMATCGICMLLKLRSLTVTEDG